MVFNLVANSPYGTLYAFGYSVHQLLRVALANHAFNIVITIIDFMED